MLLLGALDASTFRQTPVAMQFGGVGDAAYQRFTNRPHKLTDEMAFTGSFTESTLRSSNQ